MQNIINFFQQLIVLIILWKVFKFFVFGTFRSKHNHRIIKRTVLLISKFIVYIIVKLERKMDTKMEQIDIKSFPNVIPFKYHK